jgi:hypothetical protein
MGLKAQMKEGRMHYDTSPGSGFTLIRIPRFAEVIW